MSYQIRKAMGNNFAIGNTICKKSGKPFKNGSNYQTIVEFGINEQDPNQRPCAIFSDGSVCNLDMLKHICFIDIETSALGFPRGNLSMISGTSKGGKSELVKFLPIADKQGEYTVVIEDLGNLDSLSIEQGADIIIRMIDILKKEGFETPRHKVDAFDMEFIKKTYTREEVIGDTVFPVNYHSDGIITIDYPNKL